MEQRERDAVATRLPEPTALADKPAEIPDKHLVPVFDAKSVSIFYGSFRAVTDVSLTIYENEITAFIGSSGSGKSTVLRAFNRMNDLVPSAHMDGQMYYRGADLYGKEVSPTAVRR